MSGNAPEAHEFDNMFVNQMGQARGDTCHLDVIDKWGNMVTATPSGGWLSSSPAIPELGFCLSTRGQMFWLDEAHPDCIQPGKRPRITLTPTLVLKDDKPVIAISVAGGDLQDQPTLNVLLNHIDFGMAPGEAVTAPRFSTSHHENSFNPDRDRGATFGDPGGVKLQTGIAKKVKTALVQRGHKVTDVRGPIARPVMLFVDHENGTLHAAGDPQAGRHAAALD